MTSWPFFQNTLILGRPGVVNDSFAFAAEIVKQDSEFLMGSLDVDSLFTKIPRQGTIDICAKYSNSRFIKNRI